MPNPPIDVPDFAHGASAPRVQPPAPLRQSGYGFGDQPAHEHFNWWMHNVYRWVEYLRTLESGDVTLPSGHPFPGSVTTVNDALTWLATGVTAQHSVTLNELELPDGIGTPDVWSGAAGGIVVGGTAYPATSDASHTHLAASTGSLTCKNLTITSPVTITTEHPFILRVYGDLTLSAPIHVVRPKPPPTPVGQWQSPPLHNPEGEPAGHLDRSRDTTFTKGGSGVYGRGSGNGVVELASFENVMRREQYSTIQMPWWHPAIASNESPYDRIQSPVPTIPFVREMILQMAELGSPAALFPWVRGGGAHGSGMSNGATDGFGGGVLIALVSGNVIVNTGGALSCSGVDASSTTGAGGGGALCVYAGGTISVANGTPFKARGGVNSFHSVGGGGGVVTVVSRQSQASWCDVSASNGAEPGAIVTLNAIPRLML